jgi:hypothetical protein
MKSITIAFMVVSAFGLAGVAVAQSERDASGDIWVQQGKGGYSVEFVGSERVAGLQFDLYDPALSASKTICGQSVADTHSVNCTPHDQKGFVRVVVFTTTGSRLPDSTLFEVVQSSPAASIGRDRLTERDRSEQSVRLVNVLFSDARGNNLTPSHLQ